MDNNIDVIDKGRNNTLKIPNDLSGSSISIVFEGDNSFVEIGTDNVLTKFKIHVSNGARVFIGKDNKLKGNIRADSSQVFLGNGNKVTGALRLHAFEGRKIIIGDKNLISSVRIRTSDMHSIIDLTSTKRINQAKDVAIGDHVLIFEDVYIGKGVSIGNDSVIGTRSVVIRDIPPNSLAVGIPAEVKRTNITWNEKRI